MFDDFKIYISWIKKGTENLAGFATCKIEVE